MTEERAWLDVSYDEKDDAKALGARWDAAARRWYAARPDTPGLERWAARPPVPAILPGEDRSLGSGLFVDLVPSSCWFTNVRSCVDQRDWERLRRMIIGRAGDRCEACSRPEDRTIRRWLEAHERWEYQEITGVQALRRLICLCSDCHRATHYGLATLKGIAGEALAHLCTVTGMTGRQAVAHVDAAFAIWHSRCRRTWTLDLTMLTGAGITLTEPLSAVDRAAAADRGIAARRCESLREPGRRT
jgi:hypothetical protein